MVEQIVAQYIRLSMEDAKTDSLSIENQRLLLDKYMMDNDLMGSEAATVQQFVDNGYTGTNFERPAVQELLGLVREGKVKCILVKDFSRFGRDAIETGYFIERIFPLYRVRFISVSDGFDSLAHEGDTGGMEVAFKFLMNEYYSRDLSKKIRTAKREKSLRGESVTKNCVFGYVLDENRNMVIDREAAATVRLIFQMYAQEKTTVEIIQRLYKERRPTPAVWKKHRSVLTMNPEPVRNPMPVMRDDLNYVWQGSVILNMLRNEQYIGTYTAGKTSTTRIGKTKQVRNPEANWIKIAHHHPAIVALEVFDTVQEQLRIRGKQQRRHQLGTQPDTLRSLAAVDSDSSAVSDVSAVSILSALAGKVICGHCGHTMAVIKSKNASFRCWFTQSIADAACYRLRFSHDDLTERVWDCIQNRATMIIGGLDNTQTFDNAHILDNARILGNTRSPHSPAVSEYESRVESLCDEGQKCYESLVLGDLSPGEYKRQKAALDAEIMRLQQVHKNILSETKKEVPDMVTIQAVRKALAADTLTPELIDLLIERVMVFPDGRVDIKWTADWV